MSYYIGIDPGKTGAACLIQYPFIEIFDWDGVINTAAKMKEWCENYDITGSFIENVHAFPDDGNASAFRFGKNFGAWQGILCTLSIPIQLIHPKQWRKRLYLEDDKRPLKKRSLDMARTLFPDYTSKYFSKYGDHNRAEAALIAYQCEKYFIK